MSAKMKNLNTVVTLAVEKLAKSRDDQNDILQFDS